MSDRCYQKHVIIQLQADVTSERMLDWCNRRTLAEALTQPSGHDHRLEGVDVTLSPVEVKELKLPPSPPLNLTGLQKQVHDWARRNFAGKHTPADRAKQCVLGVCEEAGELAHATLKAWQGIRGTPEQHEADAQDAVGDILIYLMDLCSNKGWNLQDIVEEIVAKVTKRDWVNYPADGGGNDE